MKDNNELKIRVVAWIGINTILIIFLVLILYTKHLNSIGVICPIHDLTGIDCPGCGGTRMAMALLNLDFYQAIRYNAFLAITLIPMLILYGHESYTWIRYNKLYRKLDSVLIYYGIAFLIFGVIRNIKYFRFLAPTKIR